MSFEMVPIVIILIGVALVVVGAVVLIRQQWFLQWVKGTAGLLLVGVAVYMGMFAISLLGYNQLQEGKPLATVSFREDGHQSFVASVMVRVSSKLSSV